MEFGQEPEAGGCGDQKRLLSTAPVCVGQTDWQWREERRGDRQPAAGTHRCRVSVVAVGIHSHARGVISSEGPLWADERSWDHAPSIQEAVPCAGALGGHGGSEPLNGSGPHQVTLVT